VTRRQHVAAVVLALLALAPTVGDIGSCGQSPDDLDPIKFFQAKGGIDLSMCDECSILTERCEKLRFGHIEATEFAPGCFPHVHDGEVCLNALLASDCDDYAKYMADVGATVPTECNFCPPRPGTGAATDAGASDAAQDAP
jgi:hypothetical protein